MDILAGMMLANLSELFLGFYGKRICPAVMFCFVLFGAIMVLAMHAGLPSGGGRNRPQKNRVNALVKILTDFSVHWLNFFIGYSISHGTNFFTGVETLMDKNGYELTKRVSC